MQNSGSAITVLAVVVLFFLLGRELVCWYLKQTEQVKLLREIRDLLKNGASIPDGVETTYAGDEKIIGAKVCKSCGTKNVPSNEYCIKCGKSF